MQLMNEGNLVSGVGVNQWFIHDHNPDLSWGLRFITSVWDYRLSH